MSDLTKSMARFANCLQVHQIEFSFAAFTQEQIEAIKPSLLLSPEIEEWYRTPEIPVDFIVDWMPERITLYKPTDLVKAQFGYRWNGNPPHELDERWNLNWLVIGDNEGDPIIAHVDKQSTPISMAFHGAGEWKPLEIALI